MINAHDFLLVIILPDTARTFNLGKNGPDFRASVCCIVKINIAFTVWPGNKYLLLYCSGICHIDLTSNHITD